MSAPKVPFIQAVEDASGGNPKLPQAQFAPTGKVPVIDQGQKFIAGFTDDESLLCRVRGPVIVFGDHTRTFKFVDFPFVMGADGVKVLRVRDGWDPKYMYHYLRSRQLPSAGYSRHFKFLKEVDVPQPPLEEQRRIAAILDRADALRAKRQHELELLISLTDAAFLATFGDVVTNSRKFTDQVLADWVPASSPITYGILKPGPNIPGGMPYIRVVDIVSVIHGITSPIDRIRGG